VSTKCAAVSAAGSLSCHNPHFLEIVEIGPGLTRGNAPLILPIRRC
jgi:hypothetical protein